MSDHDTHRDNIRTLHDETLMVFLSDTHIGGDPGQDIFRSSRELEGLFDDLAAHGGAIDLIIAGDFFDCLRVSTVTDGANRVSITLAREEYQSLFQSLRRFAQGEHHRVIYLPGNHDAEVWWNHDIQTTLTQAGLVHDFARSYAACFASLPDQVIYCEHGNQFDPNNRFRDYNDPLDTPFGDHVVTDLLHRLVPRGRITSHINLSELNYVHPLALIPEWLAGRLFYDILDRALRYVLLPLFILYVAYQVLVISPQGVFEVVQQWVVEVGSDAVVLFIGFILFFIPVRRALARLALSMTESPPDKAKAVESTDAPAVIERLLNTHQSPPMSSGLTGQQIRVFISGHTHDPSLRTVERANGKSAIIVNSGCWLRQLRPVQTLFGTPPIYVASYVQTHIRIYHRDSGIHVDLWAHPKPAADRLPWLERAALLGLRPHQPKADAKPIVTLFSELPD